MSAISNVTGALIETRGNSSVRSDLTAVSTGTGTGLDTGVICSKWIAQVVSSADFSAGTLFIEGSLDNTSWYNLGTGTVSVPTAFDIATDITGAMTIAYSSATASTLPHPFRYLRARIGTNIVGGTVTVKIAASN